MTLSPLRILMVTRALPFHSLGGMEAVAWDYARAFVAAGAQVTVLTAASHKLPRDSVIDGVRISCINARSRRYSHAWWAQTSAAFPDYAASTDVVLSVGRGARTMVRARSGSQPLFLLQAHGTSWGELLSKLRQKRPLPWLRSLINVLGMAEDLAFRKFDACIAVGRLVEIELKRSPTSKINGDLPVHLIENGIDPTTFAFDKSERERIRLLYGFATDANVVLSASRLHPQKGVMQAIEGFLVAAQADPNLHMVVAGSGPDEARLRGRAKAAEHGNRVHFVGNIPRESLRGWLSAADLFLFTTMRDEGLPLNILEARAAGLPVVTSGQIADPRFGALAVDPTNSQDVGSKIISALARSNEERVNLLPEIFSLSHSADRYLALFQKMLNPEAFSVAKMPGSEDE